MNRKPLRFQTEQAIADFGMLNAGEAVLVGLSGGADSVALTHCLLAQHYPVTACHLNHTLRGEESRRDSAFVQALCTKWGIPLITEEADVKGFSLAQGISLEEAGRELRYAFFQRTAQLQGITRIATAHTLSDNLETLLLHLCRGTGLAGLCGIPPVRGCVIRPLLYCSREEVEQYCREQGLSFVTDSSNQTSDFSRNKLRLQAIPVLKEINPSLEAAFSRTVLQLARDRDCLNRLAEDAYENCMREDGILHANAVLALDPAIGSRVLVRFLQANRIAVTQERISALLAAVSAEKGSLTVNGGRQVTVRSGRILLEESEPAPYFEDILTEGHYTSPAGERYQVRIMQADTQKLQEIFNDYSSFLCLDYDKIIGTLLVRQRKAGDEILFSHRNGTRSLKKLFIEEKLTAYEKSARLVLSDAQGVAAVWGMGIAKRLAPNKDTKRLFLMQAERKGGRSK